MQVSIESRTLELVQGDITDQQVDIIVNAANSSLAGGGGVDGAIHRRGGPSIMQETDRRYPDGCPTGTAVHSTAGNLNARYIAHAVGPIWKGGSSGEADLLAGAYRHCFKLAAQLTCKSIAFPSLSTGVYAYPISQAGHIALTTIISNLKTHETLHEVRFVLFSSDAFDVFREILTDLLDAEEAKERR